MLKEEGVFLCPMTHQMAQELVDDLSKVALQLGPTASDFYNGLVTGLEAVKEGKTGLLYESHDHIPD